MSNKMKSLRNGMLISAIAVSMALGKSEYHLLSDDKFIERNLKVHKRTKPKKKRFKR